MALPDIFEANDTQPNKTLSKTTVMAPSSKAECSAGIAYNESGVATGAMGIDAADYDRIGKESLVIGKLLQ